MAKIVYGQTKIYVSYHQFSYLMEQLIKKIKRDKKKYNGVYGIPRGGVAIALHLSHNLKIPYLLKPKIGCLVVDDIADSGKTIKEYLNYDIATIYKHKNCPIEPTYYVSTNTSWIVFPYEKEDDLLSRININNIEERRNQIT